MLTSCNTTQVPKVVLEEMGPSLGLSLRRHREASSDLNREAFKAAAPAKKKVCLDYG